MNLLKHAIEAIEKSMPINVVACRLGRPPTLVRGHIFDRTASHKVEVASGLTSQENIRLVQ